MSDLRPDQRTARQIRDISRWIDSWPANVSRDREALGWHRVTKVCEEAGEAVDAWLLYTGGNPRKASGTVENVIEELLDAANAALAGVEHLTGNNGLALSMLYDKVARVTRRAGLV